ncbi:MAG: hypothetical protein R3330_05995, partial [Saprospiraceae bacterium]|nr:hypothetical protein [Saprospiraceae bacterium]
FGSHDRGSKVCDLIEPFRTADCDDVDDVDGLRNHTVTTQISDGRSIDLQVDVDVNYVVDDEDLTISSDPTRHKLVVIDASSPYLKYGQITIERVFSYDPIKAEMEYEQVYGPLGASPGGEGEGGCESGGGEIGGC